MSRSLFVFLLTPLLALAACEGATVPLAMSRPGAPFVPPVKAFAEGEAILFMHTEVSDPEIAQILTDMMRSPVLVVPELAQVPDQVLASVYVFANGIEGRGPLGFQPDVFDCPPGAACYRPLRAVQVVTWREGVEARVLKSAAEVRQAEEGGAVTIERPGVVVNMPFLEWRGGER